MDHILLSDLTSAVREKLEIRARRVGIPERAYSLKETEPDRTASLVISGDEGDDAVEILCMSVSAEDLCSVLVRESSFRHSGSPKGSAESSSHPCGWHRFDYTVSADAVRLIALYAADILEYEFSIFETVAEPFECCSRQYTCSIRGECLHPDQLYAKACKYRKILLAGNKY